MDGDIAAAWVFRRLHGMKLNLAPIFIVRHNEFPPCSVSTGDDGNVRVQELNTVPCLEDAVDVMQQFSSQHMSSNPSCVVWYVDGEREIMDTRFVLKLSVGNSSTSSSWREQLVALQGFVVPQRVESGVYVASEDEIFGSCGNLRDGAANVGINMMTKALAKCVMGGAKTSGQYMSRCKHAATPISLHRQCHQLRLDFMRAVYIVDRQGTLWFSHASEVQVQPLAKSPAVMAPFTQDNVESRAAYQLAAPELQRVSPQATKAGEPLEDGLSRVDPTQLHPGEDKSEMDSRVARPHHNKAEDGRCKPITTTPHQDNMYSASTVSDEFLAKRSLSKPTIFRWDDLPCWARQASRIALQELMRQSRRSPKKVRAGHADYPRVSKPEKVIKGESFEPRPEQLLAPVDDVHENLDATARPTVLTSPLEQHIKPEDTINRGALRPRSAQCRVPIVGAQTKLPTFNRKELKLHVGGGNVMSYRWITRAVAKPNHGGGVLGAMEALHTSQEAMGLQVAKHEPFLLIAVPGLFMTLDSMERWLGGLLEYNNHGKILLVGSLGLPCTQWADGELLDAKKQARDLSVLLWELMERGEICLSPPLCVVFVGLGSGGNAILHFAGTFLMDAKFTALRNSARFLALVNPFPASPKATSEILLVRRQLQMLKKTLDKGTHHEKLQALVTALFSAEYIEKSGRVTVLEEFWATRQSLKLPEPGCPKSAPNTPRNQHTRSINPSGVLACIDGVLRGATLGTLESTISVPVLLITSTRDALGSNTELGPSIGAEDVDSLQQLVSSNRHRRIKVYPIQAGREALQEAPVRTLEIIWGAIHAAQMKPVVPHATGSGYFRDGQSKDDVLDVIGVSGECESSLPSCSQSGDLGEGVSTDKANPLIGIPNETESGGKRKSKTSPTPSERKRDDASPKGRRAREFDARKERAAERKVKKERIKRQQELDRLKRADKQQHEILEQQQECTSMQEEDDRSTAVDRHIRDLEIWASSVAFAKERALELTSTRDASDQKLIEDQLARDRADQHIQRNELFRQRKIDLMEQDDVDEPKKRSTGVADDQLQEGRHDDVDVARDSCQGLLDQLLLLRQRIVKTMQMERLRREQLETFQTQYQRLETDLRQAERLQRTYARGGVTAGILGEVSVQDLKDVDASVARQHILLGKYQSVLNERREIWDLCVSRIQKLKIALCAKEADLRTQLQEVRVSMAGLRKKAERIRAKNESLAALRASVESKTKIMKSRVELFTTEQSLLASHTGPYFDSDIWQQGVTQRMSKATFAQDLQVELKCLARNIDGNIQQTKLIDETLVRDIAEGQKVEMITQKLGQIAHVSQERLDRMVSRTVVQELRDELDTQEQSEDASVSAKTEEKTLAEMIREKSSHQRSLEEKQWVALDILINADLYTALSVVEKEELQLNDEYKTELTREDVARILGLPHEIQLALPQMKSAAEIDAHKLLTTYTLEHGDAEFAKANEQSQDHLFLAPEVKPLSGTCSLPGEDLVIDTILPVGAGVEHTGTKQEQHQSSITVVNTMSDVAMKKLRANDGEIAIRTGEREVYRSASSLLGIQESRVHSFAIADLAPMYSVDLKAIITFSGCMDSRGFNKGRMCAVLRRKPDYPRGGVASTGECIGFSPHARQKLNTGDQFYQTPGTILIQHCPRRVPLARGTYEVEVTALGPTEYSMVVIAGQCELCASLVGKRLEEARKLKVRVTDLEGELSDTWECVRLRERQYHVCNALIEEAGSECVRCQEAIDELCEQLRPRSAGGIVGSLPESSSTEDITSTTRGSTTHSSSSTSRSTSALLTTSSTSTSSSTASSSELSEAERAQTWNEVAAIETEHMHWGRLYTMRCQEKTSVKEALQKLMKLRRDGRAEKARLEEQLQQISAEIPVVVEILNGPNAAAEISRELKVRSDEGNGGHHSSSGEGPSSLTVSLETPAGKIRQAFERGGWEALTLEEQQWITLDQSMNPDKYEWFQRQQEEEARYALEKGNKKGAKKKRNNPALDQCRFQREELMRILAESSEDLNRREIHVRKLLHKFPDDPQLVNPQGQVCSEAHDFPLAERTRMKKHDHRTATEKEWVSLDKILNPLASDESRLQIWRRAKGGVPGSTNDQRPFEPGKGDTPLHEQVVATNEQAWACPFNRDDLLRIWAHAEDTSLETEDEKRAFKLLSVYNGACPDVSKGNSHGWRGVQMGKSTEGLRTDIDERLRCLQQELDRVAHCSNPKITSSMLHAAPQRYPTSTLRLHLEAEIDRLLREQVQHRERKNVYLLEDYSSSEEDEESHGQGRKQEKRKKRRSKRRAGRGDMNIFDARKRMLLESIKTPIQRENARRIANLGPGGCPACMSNPCQRIPVVDLEETNFRLERIAEELHFARISTENVIESTWPSSVEVDGNTYFRRVDFIDELSSEQSYLRQRLKLHFIDEEFHEANRTSKQHIECVALHGYRTLLWTKDARVALEREHNRLVARAVAVEVTHDILQWMLEGWHFGERQPEHATLGHTPSVQVGQVGGLQEDEARAGDPRSLQERNEDKANMLTVPPGVDGSSWNNVSERIVKEGGIHDKEIGFMESTMHFGLFCVTVMYFRARWLLQRQRNCASDFKLGWTIDTSVPVRAQSKPVSHMTVSSTQPGYQRVKVRKEKEQAEVLADFAGFVAVEKRELYASQLIQRILRGHIGRKAAHRWREKRAEYNATNSLMVSAAVFIQRFLRGCWGRSRAKTIRAGIARWLAHLIDDEGREFEAEVLSTNKLEALKRGVEELMVDDTDSDS
ncbi:unnamed protein product [Ectocarpus fasciculatus]